MLLSDQVSKGHKLKCPEEAVKYIWYMFYTLFETSL